MAQRRSAAKQEPQSNRRWLIINDEIGKPTIGCANLYCEGISDEEKAHRISNGLKISTSVVAHHTYYGLPDPDEDGTD